MKLQDTKRIRELLNDLDFPAAKEEIVRHAREHGADPASAQALSSLPLGDYDNMAEVIRSVPVDPAPGRTEAEKVSQHRGHRKSRVAEHERPTNVSPIEEELRREERGGRPG